MQRMSCAETTEKKVLYGKPIQDFIFYWSVTVSSLESTA